MNTATEDQSLIEIVEAAERFAKAMRQSAPPGQRAEWRREQQAAYEELMAQVDAREAARAVRS